MFDKLEYDRAYHATHRAEHSEKMKLWYRKNRAAVIARTKKYYEDHKDEHQSQAKEWAASNPEKRTAIATRCQRKLRSLRPERYAARNAVSRTIRCGKLVRPSRCEKCQTQCKPHAHHHRGYEKQFWLDVIWLCRACHDAEHSHAC